MYQAFREGVRSWYPDLKKTGPLLRWFFQNISIVEMYDENNRYLIVIVEVRVKMFPKPQILTELIKCDRYWTDLIQEDANKMFGFIQSSYDASNWSELNSMRRNATV